jgi:mannosyl-3-phosphoglycerate phosphatase family protein
MGSAIVIFTDLDGTLLDHDTYDWTEALPGLKLVQQHRVPLVFCSSKTRLEQVVYRQALEVQDPFIVENGGAILMEEGTFEPPEGIPHVDGTHRVIEFGRPYLEIRSTLTELRGQEFPEVQGYGDHSVQSLMPLLGLDAKATFRATQREYEETIVTALGADRFQALEAALDQRGLSLVRGGRFISVSAGNDKGRAVEALTSLYRKRFADVVTVGIGDSWNDLPMLRTVQRPYLVQRPGGVWEDLAVPNLRRIPEVGPKGWTRAIWELLGH